MSSYVKIANEFMLKIVIDTGENIDSLSAVMCKMRHSYRLINPIRVKVQVGAA